jgi:hypothetical protein
MKQTAVGFTEELLKVILYYLDEDELYRIQEVINRAKKIEKQQIINSYIEGNYKSNMDMYWKKEAANKYYCKLYKK